jgi:NADH-quinone oxidoreductase subunit N
MSDVLTAMFPEIVLCVAACVLMLMGVSLKGSVRRAAPVIAVIALVIALFSQLSFIYGNQGHFDSRWYSVHVYEFARYVKILSSAVGVLLVLLAWPSDESGVRGPAHDVGTEAAEFYALMLFAIAGIYLVAGANDIMLLFLAIELASIPTYIMVSISRPLAVAQEAGVKYFFLGAMAAALVLFGLTYLYGTTGTTRLDLIAQRITTPTNLPAWQLMAVVLVIVGLAFKMTVVPMHFYAGDVYQGAATPVTAFLSFVPKISGFAALIKVLFAVTGGTWQIDHEVVKLLWVLSALTMTVGNVLGLVQINIKRLLAYSSIAHSGYMLAGLTALVSTNDYDIQMMALQGILFYFTAYGLTNVAIFGVLIVLPGRSNEPATSAETFDDLAGLGRQHTLLGLAMAVSCFSLIGIPLTMGFLGKALLILPAWRANLNWLVVILVVNAAISAGYYLRIIGSLFLATESPAQKLSGQSRQDTPIHHPVPVLVAIGIAMVAVLWFGTVWPSTSRLITRTAEAAHIEPAVTSSVATVDQK